MSRFLAPRSSILPAALLVLTASAMPAPASDFTVVNLANSGPGSLRQAVLDANVHSGADVVHFAPGVLGTIILTTGELSITDSLVIEGPGAGGLTISGNHESRVFRISGGVSAAISGVTITAGAATAPSDGGGILNVGSTVVLEGVVLANNHAVSAVASLPGRGGAIASIAGATLTLTDCVLSENRAVGGPRNRGIGGGILNDRGTLTVSRSLLVANQAIGGSGGGPSLGGGISSQFEAFASISDSVIVGNQAIAGNGTGSIGVARGGGIFNFASVLNVQTCTIESNLARAGSNIVGNAPAVGTAFGGGIQNADAAPLTLAECIVRGNQAIGGEGNSSSSIKSIVGCAFGGGLNNPSTATVINCLFEDNEARGGSENAGSTSGFQIVGSGTGGGINTNAGDISGEPVRLSAFNVTLRGNRALGGSENTLGEIANAGFGGGIGSNGMNNNLPVSSGSVTTLQGCTLAQNLAIGGGGGPGRGGGIANILGAVVNVTGGSFTHNRAQGGDGAEGMGGGIYNDLTSSHPSNPGVPSVLNVSAANFGTNKAQGGAGAAGDTGGHAEGGGVWNGSSATVQDSVIFRNQALGGDGTTSGGDGLGGGAYNSAAGHLRLERCSITQNRANGGEADPAGINGEGIGGAVYTMGLFELDAVTLIALNRASTSNDNIFVMP